MFTPEQRYRIEQAKDNTPTTSAFVWWVPLFVFIAWLCHTPVEPSTLGFYPASFRGNPIVQQHNPILTVFGWELL